MSTQFSAAPEAPDNSDLGRLVTCPVDQLRPHPSLVRLHIVPSSHDLSTAMGQRDQAMSEPLTVTRDGYILAGHARWAVARRQGQSTIACLQVDMTSEEALLWLIQKHQRSSSINDFSRILLALELEPWFQSRARSNQQRGGQMKGSLNLPEADKVDVRSEIANAAGVSVGNVSKVKNLITLAHPDLLKALREGEVKIHRASMWVQNPAKQLDLLRLHQNRRGITRVIASLQRRHRLQGPASEASLNFPRIAAALIAMAPDQKLSVLIGEIQLKGKAMLLSSELLNALESQEEFQL